MINGAHAIIYTKDAEADRAFFRDVLEFPFVDVGEGWLIFALPPAEVGIHPHGENDEHELFLMCDDVKAEIKRLKAKKVKCDAISTQPYGFMTSLTLPGGGKLGLYQPRHARPSAAKKPAKKK
jgi:catechol 2,3-dioxygenase-like lactoylglutathione lyase family enzyme